MNRLTSLFAASLLALPVVANAQQKRALDHDAYDSWNSIQGQALSDDGEWVLYTQAPQEGDGDLFVRSLRSERSYVVPRGQSAQFTEDNRFVVFLIKPELALTRAAEKEGQRSDQQPKDSLGILDLESGEISKVERVKSFALPEEAGGWVAYLLEAPAEETDTTAATEGEGARARPVGGRRSGGQAARAGGSGAGGAEKQDGTVLILRNLSSGGEQQFEMVQAYAFSKDGRHLAYTAASKDSTADGAFV
ncbi:MAG: hypothetical protein AMS18_12645, partial [Gemmatimonas sp. SG8_17]